MDRCQLKESDMSRQLELIDLGDATEETRQWGIWPIVMDSIFILAEYPDS